MKYHTKHITAFLFLGMLIFLNLSSMAAELGFSRYFSDGMVLQRGKALQIRGTAPAKAPVTIRFAGQTKQATAGKDGEWTVVLDPLTAAAEGQNLTLMSGKQNVVLHNIVVGDVFLFARQTSVDVSLGRDKEGRSAASKAGKTDFRTIMITTVPAPEALNDLPREATSGWSRVDKKTALTMSGAAFYLGTGLAKTSSVPIGIVDLNMSYYFPIAWMSREDLLATGDVMPEDTGKELYQEDNAVSAQVGKRTRDLDTFRKRQKEAAEGKPGPNPESPVTPVSPLEDPRFPAAGYNSVMNPLRGMAFKGVVLQLGNDYPYVMYQKIAREGNRLRRAHLGWAYERTYDIRKWCIYLEPWTLPRMVPQWRLYLDDSDLPFGLIMPPGSDLATLGEHHCWIRELQRKVAETHSGVGLIMPGTEHLPLSAQPADEKLLGERALSWVRSVADDGRDAASSGPLFDRFESDYSRATVFFKKGTADGLKAEGTALDKFEVAGVDAVYHPAKAKIDGDTVLLECDKVNQIANVRYNWMHKPAQGLKNAAGLPAVPFRTDDPAYPQVFWHSENDLPEEYSTPARDWKSGDVAIVNGSLAPGNWHDGEGLLGPCGVKVAPFGPNMAVIAVQNGSPAEGKILVGDLIYDVNGRLFGDHPLKDAAKAIAYAESAEGDGHISFGLRREGKNLDVALKLEVLGSYSSTSPYDCPKTDRIVENMEEFLAERGGVMRSHTTFKNCDALFMLAAGTPEYQGLVRRHVYSQMARRDLSKRLDPMKGPFPKNWEPAYDALLAGEYYLATGDTNVLPFLKWNCDYLAMTQNKVEASATPWPTALAGQAGGWRHNFYGKQSYGMLPNVGLPALLGFRFAIEAGVDVDRAAYKRGIDYFIHNGARVGSVFYGHTPEPVTVPKPIDNDKLARGMLSSFNGAKALAALLFKFEGDLRTAHLLSFVCANSYNNLHHAHGGNFWGNAWTGLGAYAHSKDAFMKFVQGHAWYLDLHRLYTHGHYQGMRGGIGGGQYLALVLPRHRLRILWAPESIFSEHPEEFFRPALKTHRARDYARCADIVKELMTSRTLSVENKAKAEQLLTLCNELQNSIEFDLTKVEGLIKQGKLYEASLDLPQLKGVVAADNSRLIAIRKKLEDPAAKDILSKDKSRYDDRMKSLFSRAKFSSGKKEKDEQDEALWTCLTPHSELVGPAFRHAPGLVSEEDAIRWRMKVVESIKTAPEDWPERGFDDSSWLETTLPISWPLNHTALFRTSFEVKDRKDIEALRMRVYTYRQQNVQVFINGKLVAKINKASNNNVTTARLTEEAVKALKRGRNTIAVTTRSNWRWGSYMGGNGTDANNSVRNNGFTLLLDARNKGSR